MKDLLFIEKMLTSKIITFVYWLMLLFAVINGVAVISMVGGFIGFMMGIITIVLSACMARIFCECFAVIFKCFEQLKQINHNLAPKE